MAGSRAAPSADWRGFTRDSLKFLVLVLVHKRWTSHQSTSCSVWKRPNGRKDNAQSTVQASGCKSTCVCQRGGRGGRDRLRHALGGVGAGRAQRIRRLQVPAQGAGGQREIGRRAE